MVINIINMEDVEMIIEMKHDEIEMAAGGMKSNSPLLDTLEIVVGSADKVVGVVSMAVTVAVATVKVMRAISTRRK